MPPIRGAVTDDSGAVPPGVTVTATSPALIAAEVVVSDSQGGYRFLNLPVVEFTIEASLPGFATYRQEGILVRASTNIGVDMVMSISQVEETITVTAETPMLEIARPGNILTIEGEFQRDLPIQARGNWSDFLEMTPGVNARPFDDGSGRMIYFGHATEHFSRLQTARVVCPWRISMFDHPLMRLARRTPIPETPPVPPDADYDPVRGAWADRRTGELLVCSSQSRPRPQTKKEDVERGEDQKGY